MDPKALAPHVLFHLRQAHLSDERVDFEALAKEIKVRRGDVRKVLRLLHQQDLYDCMRNRLTLQGFAVATAMMGKPLPELRPWRNLKIVAA